MTSISQKTVIMTAILTVSLSGMSMAYATSLYDAGPYAEFGSNPVGTSGGAYGSADTNGNGEIELSPLVSTVQRMPLHFLT